MTSAELTTESLHESAIGLMISSGIRLDTLRSISMTTDDFRDKVEKLGFKTYRGNNVVSIKKAEVVVASVSIDKWARYDLSSRSAY